MKYTRRPFSRRSTASLSTGVHGGPQVNRIEQVRIYHKGTPYPPPRTDIQIRLKTLSSRKLRMRTVNTIFSNTARLPERHMK